MGFKIDTLAKLVGLQKPNTSLRQNYNSLKSAPSSKSILNQKTSQFKYDVKFFPEFPRKSSKILLKMLKF